MNGPSMIPRHLFIAISVLVLAVLGMSLYAWRMRGRAAAGPAVSIAVARMATTGAERGSHTASLGRLSGARSPGRRPEYVLARDQCIAGQQAAS